MKNVIIVLSCLIPLALALGYGIYKKNNCMSEKEAEAMYKSALGKEKSGKEAYNLFKQIDAYACENFEIRGRAFDKAVNLKNKSGQ